MMSGREAGVDSEIPKGDSTSEKYDGFFGGKTSSEFNYTCYSVKVLTFPLKMLLLFAKRK